MSNYILMVQLDIDEDHVDEFNKLYDDEHFPHLLDVTGVISGQRYEIESDADNQLRYLIIYQLESPDIPSGDEWKEASVAPAYMKVRKYITGRRRGVFKKM
jgi:hypothetical protein